MGAISAALAAAGKYALQKGASYAIKKIKKKARKKVAETAGKYLGKEGQAMVQSQSEKYLGGGAGEGKGKGKGKVNPSRGRIKDTSSSSTSGGGGGGGGGGPFSKINKGEVNMVKRGLVKEKGTQAGAYSHAPSMAAKKANYAMEAASHAQKKLLTEPRALTYSKFGSMKTRK